MTDLENREAFERWFKTTWNGIDLCQSIGELSAFQLDGDSKYFEDYVQNSWESWQASTQREGFKLVPLEPTLSMIEAAAEEHATNGASYKTMFKAMINAV